MSIGADTKQDGITIQDFRGHAWDYFSLHAEQRIKMFHFFILLETGLVGALVVSARVASGMTSPLMFQVIGSFMVLMAFVFWKLDQRTKGMIKVSERALRQFEQRAATDLSDVGVSSVTPFSNDPQETQGLGMNPFGRISYSKCFGLIYLAFALLGIGTFIQVIR